MVAFVLLIENSPQQLGYEVAKRMLNQGLNSRDLAKAIGVSEKTISRLINGHTVLPRNETLKKIADALGCIPSDLVFREGRNHADDRSEDPEGLPG